MLRDVTTKVSDGLLGIAGATGDGIHVKIGASPVDATTPITITGNMDAQTIKSRLGLSPLADAVMDSVLYGAGLIYCLPVAATTHGTFGEVTKAGTGQGGMAVSGSPTNAFAVVVKITAQGGLNAAAFAVSIDGGVTFGDELTVPVTGEYDLEGTGIQLKFTEGSDPSASSFVVDDTFSFSTTAPAMTNGDVLAAMDKLQTFTAEYEYVHIVGGSDVALWLAASEAQIKLRDVYHKPVFVLMEAVKPDAGGLADWATEMAQKRKQVKNYDVQVCAAWGRLVKMDGTTQMVNLAGVAAGLYAKAKVHESIGKTREEAGFAIWKNRLLELLPGMDDSVIEILDVADYLTFREYDGLSGYYVYHTKMMSPANSDYRYAEDVRVKNKIIREVRKQGLLQLNDDIDMEDVQSELETRAKFMAAPLQAMIAAKEISSVEITVADDAGETFLKDGIMRVKVRYVSRGHIREVMVDIGRTQTSS